MSKKVKNSGNNLKNGEYGYPKLSSFLDFKSSTGKVFISFLIAVGILLFVFINFKVKLENTWETAAKKLDSSLIESGSFERSRLINEGGEILKDLLKKYPNHAKLHFLMGFYYFLLPDYYKAIHEYEMTIKLDSRGVVNKIEYLALDRIAEVLLRESNYLIKSNKIDSAINIVSFYHNKYPKHLTILQILSRLYNLNQDADSALIYLGKGIKMFPMNPDLLALAGNAYQLKLDTAKALEFYDKALGYNPGLGHIRKLYNELRKNYKMYK